jgi:hypothetical protein
MRKHTLSAAILAALTLATLAPAQSTTQTIQGLVTDSTGAVVNGAKVTITNVATGVAASANTNETGNYTFPLVLVGNYDVKVEMQGFKTEVVRNIRVETAAQVRQDFQLQVGSVAESIEVAASAALLNTENATVGAVIENRRIVELPLNGRNMQNLAVLVPGVQYGIRTGRSDGSGGFPIPGQGFGVIANGQRETSQVISLDGVDAKDPRIHIANFVPSIEAIEEFKIQTNAYSAEYGFGSGAQVTITMKSGTNQLRGTFFNFLRNDVFDAENYFLNFELAPGATRAKKNTLRQNQFGFVLSGPVLFPKYDGRNKTFWAVNWEARRTRQALVQTANWPMDEFRNGDFSRLQRGYTVGTRFVNPIIIYDPNTGTPIPNNMIPASQIHRGARNVLDQFVPRAQFVQADPLDFTARAAVPQPVDVNTYFVRVDHNFSDRDRVFGRIALDRSNLTRTNINPNLPVFVDSKVSNLATQWIHTFSPTVINEFRVGFNISDDITRNPRTDNTSFDQDALGVGQFRIPSDGNRKLTPREHGIPQFTGLPFTLQELTNGNGYDNMDTIQPSNHLTWIKGKHNFKMGGEYYRVSMERGAANLEEGLLNFNASVCGNAFACFLMGRLNQSQTPEGLPLTFPRANRFAGYFHDDWKVSPKLTINAGLRFDYNGFPVDSQGLWRTFDIPGLGGDIGRGGGYTVPGTSRVIPTVFPTQVNPSGAVKLTRQRIKFFMPRLGIAYRPTEKWVLRMGAGWFDIIQHVNTWTIFNLMPPKAGSQVYNVVMQVLPQVPVPSNGPTGTFNFTPQRYAPGSNILTFDDPFLTRTTGQSVVRPIDVLYLPPDYTDGNVWKWSFDVQRELPWQTAFTIGYAGSKGTNIGNSVINYNDPVRLSASAQQANRPYPEYFDPALPQAGVQGTGRIRYIDSFGESFYHGMQVRFDKRSNRGLTFGLAYTYSKTHGDGDNGGQEGINLQNPRDRRGSRGLVSFDQTHKTVANFVWELPGSNWKGIQGAVLGGWQMNGIATIASGFPFTIGQGAGDIGMFLSPVRPDVVGQAERDDPTRKLWFNPQAFQRVTCQIASRQDLCHYGSAGNNILRGPGQRNVDFSLYKNFKLTERFGLQFRWEAFNFFNTPWFGNPGGISFSSPSQVVPDGTRDGEIRSIQTPMRIMQFGLKLRF